MGSPLPDLTRFLPALQAGAAAAAAEIADAVRQYVPVSPRGDGAGKAAASLYAESEATATGATVRVLSDDPVVGFLLNGTPPHTITAQHYLDDGRLGFLRFEATDGGIVYVHEVHSPGMPATRFDLAATNELDAIRERVITEALEVAFQ